MVQQRTAKPKKKAAAKAGHKHRAAGTKKKKTGGKKGLLAAIGKKPTTAKKAKEEKPTITLEDQAETLLGLQQAKADLAEAKGRVAELEAELLPEMEEHRLGLCEAQSKYIRSINVRATGEDADGNEIKAGQALFYIQNRYSAFDPTAPSTDEDVINAVGDEATIRDEAIFYIAAALEVEWDEAEEHYDTRIEDKVVITLKDGALEDEAVIEVLQEHLLEWLVSTTKATPTESFHERSNFIEEDKIVMAALQDDANLCKRSKGTVKASGAPKAARRAVKIK